MSKLYVTEYTSSAAQYVVGAQAAQVPGTTQVVDFSLGVASSAAFAADTLLVRIHSDAICSFKFGSAPVATTSDARMAAGSTEYFGTRGGNVVSVIANT